MDKTYLEFGKKSLYIFLILSFFGIIFSTIGKFASDTDFYDGANAGFFNISFLISAFLFNDANVF